VEAAFFDLDKTVIARPSMVAFGRPLRRAGLVSPWVLARALAGQVVYLWLGADEARLLRTRDAALALTKGWHRDTVERIVRETLEEVVDPIVFDEALQLMAAHRAAGRLVVVVSASPEEVVRPLSTYLGAHEAVATRSKLDAEGRYTGELERFCSGPDKVEAIRALADARGIDLAASYAYSDSVTDVPMLEAVGHPVAVNPDRALLRVARARDWEVRRFVKPVRLRDRVQMPSGTTAAVAGGGLTAMAALGAAAWWFRRRGASGWRRRRA
jgi:HAD superfamily hydrolase (TIGR01490 family)